MKMKELFGTRVEGGIPGALSPLDLYMIYDNIFNKLVSQQECIPVGCVLPALYCRGGLPDGGSHAQRPPQTETPMDSDTPWTETLPRQILPLDRTPPPWTETRNFVYGW